MKQNPVIQAMIIRQVKHQFLHQVNHPVIRQINHIVLRQANHLFLIIVKQVVAPVQAQKSMRDMPERNTIVKNTMMN